MILISIVSRLNVRVNQLHADVRFVIFLSVGGFFISVSLQPSGKTLLEFPNEENYYALKPVIETLL